MKKLSLLSVLCFIFISSLTAQIKVNNSGYVGINNVSPYYRLDISGDFRITYNSTAIVYNGSSFTPVTGFPSLGSSSNAWYELYAYDAYFYSDPIIMSDMDFKTDIISLGEMKGKVNLLRPVTYSLNKISVDAPIDSLNSNLHYGLIAQELQEVFPDLVIKRNDGKLGIRYVGLIPVLIQTIKEQQSEIESLANRISELEKAIK